MTDMTMLTDTRVPFEPATYPSAQRTAVRPGARLALIKQICLYAVTIILAGGALTGIIALKTAIYFWRFHYF